MLKLIVAESKSKNPLLDKNWAGYSGFSATIDLSQKHPSLWNALQMLAEMELSGYAHKFLNEKFPEEGLDFGKVALDRLQFIEASIAKDLFISGKLQGYTSKYFYFKCFS